MGILTNVYVKIEKTSFEEDNNGNYIATCLVSMYRDESKGTLISREEIKIENLKLEDLSLQNIYGVLMNNYIGSKFI